MVFNVLSALRVLVLQDEMNLVGGTTFVWAKHDRVRRLVVESLGGPASFLWAKIFQIRTTTFKTILKTNFKLENNGTRP